MFAGVNGYLDDLKVSDVGMFEKFMIDEFRQIIKTFLKQ